MNVIEASVKAQERANQPPGAWRAQAGRGYNSRPFWNVVRFNARCMFSTEYVNTTRGAKRFYKEQAAIDMAAKLNGTDGVPQVSRGTDGTRNGETK